MKPWIIYILVLFLISCDSGQNKKSSKKKVVATTSMISDAIHSIGGSLLEVTCLMGGGVDPHLYKATPYDSKKMMEADVIFYNGLHLEGKMTEVLDNIANKKPVYAISKQIPVSALRRIEGFEDSHDPHIWFDVSIWKKVVAYITEILCEIDTTNQKAYLENSKKYLLQLDDLHTWVKKEISSIPKESRVLITAHDAFGYFGLAYDIEVLGLQGVSTAAEYGTKDIENLVEVIVKRKIYAIFVEDSVSSRAIEAVIEGCKSMKHKVQIGGSLFSDALGSDAKVNKSVVRYSVETYIGMVQYNVSTIVRGLSGSIGK